MNDSSQLHEQPFIGHLIELRDRLLRMVLVVLVVFLVLFPFGNDIYAIIAEPLMAVLPEGTSMIATQVASPFLTPFKLALVAAIFLSMPFLLYQFWAFIAPGLYQHEKRLALPLVASSVLLFYLGAAFAYFVVFPLVFAFFTSVAPEGVAVMTDITHYLDFVLTLFFAFGMAFEVPIATILLVAVGMTTPQKLGEKRPYVIVGAFVVGMLLTPPDVISQTLLALPVWLLFEVGVFFSRMFVRKKDDEDADDDVVDYAEPVAATSAVATQAAAAGSAAAATSDADDDFRPMTDEEMDAELDRIEAEEDDDYDEDYGDDYDEDEASGDTTDTTDSSDAPGFQPDAVDAKLERVMELRDSEQFDEARTLLYEVLVEGNDSQVKVAKNILAQMDG